MLLESSKILVTGGAGFLGRAVCSELRRRGANNIVVPRRTETDLTKPDQVEGLIEATRPQVVIHLAAEVGGIGANQNNPGRFFFANMAMGLHLMEASRKARIEKFVQIGTVCSYPKWAEVPFREEALWEGYPEETNAPYGVAKKALLTMMQAYRDQYGFPGIYLIPVNLYGPGDNFDPASSHVIPALIRKLVRARNEGLGTVDVWGSGSASREFLFVDDAARAIVEATHVYDGELPVNIGTGDEITIRELVGLIKDLVGYGGSVHWDTSKPDGQPRRRLDTSRAKAEFGFVASTALADGLRETIRWWEDSGMRSEGR